MKNYDLMTIAEMEELYNELGKEIERRKANEMAEDWEKLVEQIKLFLKRHGQISIIDEINEEDWIDLEANFEDPGMIYLPRV